MTKLIEAEHLYRYYGQHCAVNDLNLSLEKGQVMGFLGPNGAGKTTTMQMLAANLAPDSGLIKINGFDLQHQATDAKRHLGYLPEIPPLYKDLTVTEFLEYCAKLQGLNRQEIPVALAKALDRCGLGQVADRLINNLSKGFQQRIGIAQAIVHNPILLILDEPTVGLDPLQIREIRSLIRELGKDHGVILSTHILSEVQESCTHVHIINKGHSLLSESIIGLEQQMNTGILLLTTRKKPDTAILSAILGVNSIETVTDNQLKIHYSTNHNPVQQLTETVIAAGWELTEISTVKKSLEDIFIALTGEASGKDL
jgi:ABC-2 type transport system ATP-binding protein